MTDHYWVIEERECYIDSYDVCFCSVCGAHYNNYFPEWGFYVDGNRDIKLSQDCDEAQRQMIDFKRRYEEGVNRKIAKWTHSQAKKHHKIKRPLWIYLGWWEEEYKRYLETGEIPYQHPIEWYP